MRVIILGGGIGGTYLALSIQRLNLPHITHTLCEATPQIKPLGAGLALAPNSLASASFLGDDLMQGIKSFSAPVKGLKIYSGTKYINFQNFDFVGERFGYPLMLCSRAELQGLLYNKLLEGKRPGKDEVLLDKKCVKIEQDETKVRAYFLDGSVVEGDVLIGADGIHSIARKHVLGKGDIKGDIGIRYSGLTCLLAISKSCDIGVPEGISVQIYDKAKTYGTWVMKDHRQYFFLVKRDSRIPSTDWSTETSLDMEELLTYPFPFDMARVVKNSDRALKLGLFEADRMDAWNWGRVSLLGDAAHQMVPSAGQGANMAIEDATVLTHLLSKGNDPYLMLEEYQGRRKKRSEQVIKMASMISRIQSLENPLAIWMRDYAYRWTTPNMLAKSTQWLYSYQPTLDRI